MRLISLAVVVVLVSRLPAQNAQHGLRVPAGFEVVEYADSKLANDIFTMTLDPKGRVVVAGRGYIRLLIEKDGKADSVIEVADAPKEGAMGLLWEKDYLYFTGDGGLRRYHIKNDRADGPSELLCKLKTGGEHDAHAIRRGPDGWLYVLCGNNTNVDKLVKPAATSPIKNPVAGCVLRFSPDFKTTEIVAQGFRNAYDMDFNTDGELFTFDSDNERCVSLPWYEPTRFYHVVPGGHHGWLNPQQASFWRMPPYYPDVTPPLATLGRGSPTGCICYRHGQFPEKYRDGFFLCDWTFGQIHFIKLRKLSENESVLARQRYEARSETFLQSVGENGFAPTAAAVHPETGDLFVCIGGRGTRGAVYRIRYPDGIKQAKKESARWQMKHHEWVPYRGKSQVQWNNLLLNGTTKDREEIYQRVARFGRMYFNSTDCSGEQERLGILRFWQSVVGDRILPSARGTVWEGYARERLADDWAHVQSIRATLRLRFPYAYNDADIDREMSRLLAILEDDDKGVLERTTKKITAKSDPIEDIHYLIVLSRLKAARSKEITSSTATALLALDAKLDARRANRDSNWPLRMVELHRVLAKKDAALNDALLAHKDFGRPDHAIWTQVPGFDRKKAATIFLARAAKDRSYPWNAGLVQLIGDLPDETSLPALRRLWDQAGLNDVILPLLARRPGVEDRERFLQGLASPSLNVVRDCLDALTKLPPSKDGATLFALVQSMRLLPDGKEEDKTRVRIGQLLRKLTALELAENDRQAWIDWLKKAHPKEAEKLGGEDGVDMAAWTKRLASIDWQKGDVERGRGTFTKASCISCHSGSQAMGPDLQGIAGRFSRADLFTAILRPSKDVSARYRTTVLTTDEGKTYQGIIVYEAVDSVLLQTGPATTVRLAHKQIAEKKLSPLSLMPVGLLDRLEDRDIADLYTYLKSLSPRR
jgi:putative heme-binding domain-containing protein